MKLYIVIFSHKHGIDVWPEWSSVEIDEEEIKKDLDDDMEPGEWDRYDTYLEVHGPYGIPNRFNTFLNKIVSFVKNLTRRSRPRLKE